MPGAHPDDPPPLPAAAVVVLAVAVTAYSLMQSLVVPALPVLARTLDTSPAQTSWALTAFLLSASVSTALAGRLGDLRGKRPVLVGVVLVVLAGTLVCAVVRTYPGLVGGRVLQGVGAGMLPLAFSMVRDHTPPGAVAGRIAVLSSLVGVGGALGVLGAGALLEVASPAWLFWLQVPILAGLAWGVHRTLPESPTRDAGRVDWPGAATLSAGLVLVLLAITQAQAWGPGSATTLAVAGGGVLVLARFLRSAARREDPVVDVRLLRRRAVLTPNLATALLGAAQFVSFVVLPQFVQEPLSTGYGFGSRPLAAAVFLLPMTAAMVAVGVLAGRLQRRLGPRTTVLAGTGVAALGFGLITVLRAEPWHVHVASGLMGAGFGVALPGVTALVLAAVPAHQTGAAAGVNNVARTLGGAVGTQASAALLAVSVVGLGGAPTDAGYTWAFAVGLGALAAVLALGPLLPGGPERAVAGAPSTRAPRGPWGSRQGRAVDRRAARPTQGPSRAWSGRRAP